MGWVGGVALNPRSVLFPELTSIAVSSGKGTVFPEIKLPPLIMIAHLTPVWSQRRSLPPHRRGDRTFVGGISRRCRDRPTNSPRSRSRRAVARAASLLL